MVIIIVQNLAQKVLNFPIFVPLQHVVFTNSEDRWLTWMTAIG